MGVKAPISRKHADILRALNHFNARQRAIVLRCVDLNLIKIICEISLNILNGNIALPKNQKLRLKRYANILRKLAKPRENLKSKKKYILQQQGKGGFLPLLLSTIASSILSNLLSDK